MEQESLFSKLVNSKSSRKSSKKVEEYEPIPKTSKEYDPEDYVFRPTPGYSTTTDPSSSPYYIPCYVTPFELAQDTSEDLEFTFNEDEINTLLQLNDNDDEVEKIEEDNHEEEEDDVEGDSEQKYNEETEDEDEPDNVNEDAPEEDEESEEQDEEMEVQSDEVQEQEEEEENSNSDGDAYVPIQTEGETYYTPNKKSRIGLKATEDNEPTIKGKTKKSIYDVLKERYHKTQIKPKDDILMPAPRKFRIAPVLNVQSILEEKKRLLSKRKNVTVAQTNKVRKAHQPVDVKSVKHIITQGSKYIPRNIRQYCFDKILAEVCKIYPTKDECLNESIKLEEELFNNVTKLDAYKASYAKTISQLKTKINVLHGKVKIDDRLSRTLHNGNKKLEVQQLSEKELYDRLLYYKLAPDKLKQSGYPIMQANGRATCYFDMNFSFNKKYTYIKNTDVNRRYCIRCSKEFDIDPITKKQIKTGPDTCVYHSGRPRNTRVGRVYNCCSGLEGCETNHYHVTECDYQDIQCAKASGSKKKVFALDCEMVYTLVGSELARVTVVGYNKEVVYDTLVKPKYEILDYNSKFSGLDENNMKNARTTLKDVHAKLLKMFGSDTILIGHSLDSDLRALRFAHETVIDTSIVFPSMVNPAYKRSLKELSANFLTKLIQDGESGHDATEDAVTALELMLVKVREDF